MRRQLHSMTLIRPKVAPSRSQIMSLGEHSNSTKALNSTASAQPAIAGRHKTLLYLFPSITSRRFT